MSLYSIALFVHIVGAIALFALLTIEGVSLRAGTSARAVQQVLGPLTLSTIVLPGFYMAAQIGWHAWVAVGLAGYAVIAVLGAYTGIALIRARLSTRAATISWMARVGIALGIVFDMTVKPELAGSLVAVALAVVVALAAAVPVVRRVVRVS